MRHASRVLVFAAALVMTVGATSESVALLGSSHRACEAAVNGACSGVKPGEGRARACIERHFHALSGPCEDKLAHVAEIERACEPDVHRLCAHMWLLKSWRA